MFADSNLTRWKSCLRAGHAAWLQGDFAGAARAFHEALCEAEEIMLHRYEDLPVARMYVFSARHLAEAYRLLGLPGQARRCERDIQGRLRRIVHDPGMPLALRRGCTTELGNVMSSPRTEPVAPAEPRSRIGDTRRVG